MKDSHRIQALGVLFLAAFAWLAFDLGAVKDGVRSFLDGRDARADDLAVKPPAPAAPTLIGHPKARPPHVASVPRPPSAGGNGGSGGRGVVEAAASKVRGGRRPSLPGVRVTTWMSVDAKPQLKSLADIARALRLDERQMDEVRRILEDAARELDDLRHMRNDDGQTWHGVVASVEVTGWGAHRALMLALGDFVDTSLGGRGETYRSERQRILERYAQVIRGQLDPEQQNDFDKYDVTRVIDRGGHPHAFTVKRLGTMKKTLDELKAARLS